MSERAPACPGPNVLAMFLDGRLGARDCEAVQAHVDTCDACLELVAETLMLSAPVLLARRVAATTSPSALRLFRGRVAAGAMAAAAVLAAALLIPGLWPLRESRGPKLADLADAAGLGRPVEGRLTGGFTHRPWFAPLAGGQGGAMTSPTAIQLAAGKIRGNLETRGTPARLHAFGVSQLLLGRWDEAARALTAAAREQPKDAAYQSDLAALYLERVRSGGHPGDLIKALAAAERGRLADPGLLEAWFNRALALEYLALGSQARAAWHDYLARDARSPWADEARAHLSALNAQSAAAQWPAIATRLRAGVDSALADAAVRVQTSEARLFLETVLWPAWAAAVQAGHPASSEREALRAMAGALLRLTGDSLYHDAVTALDKAEHGGLATLRGLAAAHAEYDAATTLARQDLVTAARPRLVEARARLARSGSPFALRAELDVAANHYYAGRAAEATALLFPLLDSARHSGYRHLEARSSWLLGLLAFAQARYGDARGLWEQMLTAAEQGGDVEQQAAAHGLLANLLDHLGDSAAAWQHRRVALNAMERSGATRLRFGLLLSAAGQALKEHDPAAALALQDAVVETALQSPRPAGIAEALAGRAAVHAALGLADKARRDLAAAKLQLQSIADAALRERVEATVITAEVNVLRALDDPGVTTAAERAIELLVQRKETARLPRMYLTLGETSLRQGHLDRADKAAAAGIALLEAEEAGRASPAARVDQSWMLYGVALRLALARGDVNAAFAFGNLARSRGLRAPGSQPGGVTPQAIQAQLGADDALIALNQLEDELIVWVVTSQDIRYTVRPLSRDDATRLVLRQADEITMAAAAPRAAAALFREIVRPVLPALQRTARVTIAPDAPYFAASFAGLWSAENGRFWIEDVEIAVASQLASERNGSGVSGRSAVIDVDTEATPDDVIGIWHKAPANAVIQMPALAAANNTTPHLSRVVLSDVPGRPYSGTWLAEDVTALPRVRAVLLSNTDPGNQAIYAGGSYDVASAFLGAGTHVVSTIAAAPLEADLAGRLRQQLEDQDSVVGAVAAFQREIIRSAGQRLGPWSCVVVYGAGR